MPRPPSRSISRQPSRRRVLSALAGGALLARHPGQVLAGATEVVIGGRLREATLQGLNGPPRKLSAFLGKPLLINVWASWCGPCREEAPSLERLAWNPLAAGFNLIGISTDDRVEDAQAWLRESHATLNHFLDHDLQMETMLGASKLPLTVLVDGGGRVLDKVYGARDWSGQDAIARLRRMFRLAQPDGGSSRT